ncbi:MAG: hypothetical protein SGILL_003729 [Bacillariaceae sp.]
METFVVPEGYPVKGAWIYEKGTEESLPIECEYSPIPHHLVLHGAFSVMLGEFYSRILLGLSQIFLTVLKTEHQQELFVKSTQLYLHINKKKKQLLEGHEMFLNLFSRHQPKAYAALLESAHLIHCQCFRYLTFCGYNKASDSRKKKYATNVPKTGLTLATAENTVNSTAMNGQPYQYLQKLIYEKFVSTQTHRQEEILVWRKSHAHHVRNEEIYTIIGLAQRQGRRRWTDVTQVLEECNAWGAGHFSNTDLKALGIVSDGTVVKRKVKCVEINVDQEYMQNPEHHVLEHASLDALIGIHGSHLTNAVLMKPGSVFVELLPWIPSKSLKGWGWTNTVDRPTPVGIAFHNTQLNHIGVPLTIDSMPTDTCVTNGTYTLKCYKKAENVWAERDFRFDGAAVIDVIDRLVLPLTKKQSQSRSAAFALDLQPTHNSCQDLVQKAGDDYVLYNVHCSGGSGGKVSPHHYYHDQEWIYKKTVPNPLS